MTITNSIDTVFSWILPLPSKREAYTWKTAPLMFASVGLLLISSYIRLRCTKLPFIFRLAFGLVVIPISFCLGISRFNDWELKNFLGTMNFNGVMIDFVLGVNSIFSTLLITEFLFLGSEEDFGVRGAKEYQSWQSKQTQKSNGFHNNSFERPRLFPGTSRWLELDLAMSLRGLGYERGLDQSKEEYEAGYKALIESKKLSGKNKIEEAQQLKRQTIIKTIRVFLVCFLTMDFIETFYRNPKVFSIEKCSKGPCSLDELVRIDSPLGTYRTTIISAMMGVFLVADMQAYYCLVYLIALIFTWNPIDIPITISLYEPMLFYRPHISTSLKDLWGKHWHALFRRPFLLFAYRPANKFALLLKFPKKVARAFGILATFVLSGLLHEMVLEAVLPHFKEWDLQNGIKGPLRTPQRGFGANSFVSTRFFLAQGVGIISEDVFINTIEPKLTSILFNDEKQKRTRLIENKSMRSLFGWFWCMSFIVYFGQGLIDIWLRHGIATLQFSFSITKPITEFLLNSVSKY